jgi:hypothetical protein
LGRAPVPKTLRQRAKKNRAPINEHFNADDCQRAANIGEQPIEADEYQSVDAAEEKPLWRGPPQDIDLLAQHQDLDNIARFAAARQPDEVSDRDRNS